MMIWQWVDGFRWRCEPCQWESDGAEFCIQETWEREGSPVTPGACPKCGRHMERVGEH
jgi:hypothetical protein